MSRKATSSEARQFNIKNGIVVKKTELIGPINKNITSPTDANALLTLYRLRINPGSKSTFNWLAGIALNYEYYRFRHVALVYETRCSTITSGSLVISPDYDAEDGQFAVSEQQLFNNKGTTDDSLWKSQRCVLSPAAMNRLYKSHAIMSDARFATTDQDTKTVDCAQVFVCIDTGDTVVAKYGKLFIEYEVELTEPQSPTESIIDGGFSSQIGASSTLAQNSLAPIASAAQLVLKSDNNILKPANEILTTTYPTAVIGQFARDFSGLVNSQVGATAAGLTSGLNLYLSKNPGAVNTAVDQLVPTYGSQVLNSGSTLADRMFKLEASAGDFLKFQTPNANGPVTAGFAAGGLASFL